VRAAESGAPRNDVAALNSRRLALPSKLTDRLLAGIVPSAATSNSAAVPPRDGQQVAKAFAVPDNGLRIVGRAVAQPPLAPNKAFSDSDTFVATMLPMAEQAAKRI
ncbi:MAG: flagellar assembly peptidoglycan hydrolase FlgJ, partial [Pseudomonas sp.]